MFSLCFSCASGYFCFLLVSIHCCSQQEGKGEAGSGEGRGEGGGPDTDHLQKWYELSWQKILPVSGDRLWGSFSFKQKSFNWDWELFPKRSLSAASVLNSRHGFNFLNRILWQTLRGVQPNLFWSVEGTGSKFISQIKRQRHAGCISFVRLRAHAWQRSAESHLMNVTQASLILGEGCEWKRNINLIEMFSQRPCWDVKKYIYFFTFSPKKVFW